MKYTNHKKTNREVVKTKREAKYTRNTKDQYSCKEDVVLYWICSKQAKDVADEIIESAINLKEEDGYLIIETIGGASYMYRLEDMEKK